MVDTIEIEGKRFTLKDGHRKKKPAQNSATRWRNKGYNARVIRDARVIRVGSDWRVYVRRKK